MRPRSDDSGFDPRLASKIIQRAAFSAAGPDNPNQYIAEVCGECRDLTAAPRGDDSAQSADDHQPRAASTANTWTWFSEGGSSYNALQVDSNHRFSHGFYLGGVYTWAKTIDDSDSLIATTSSGEPALASNPFNLRANRGLANFDVRNVGVISASYGLPFRAQNLLARRWTLNTIVTLQYAECDRVHADGCFADRGPGDEYIDDFPADSVRFEALVVSTGQVDNKCFD
jgi:hypothetical protein